jgi:hypothetical protein
MKRIIFHTALLFIITCNSTVIKVTPSYSSATEPASAQCALIIPELINIEFSGSVGKTLGEGLKTVVIPDFFREQLFTDLQKVSRFSKMYNSYLLEDFPSRKKRLSTRRGRRAITIPLPGEKVKCQSVEPEIVIKLENVSIASQPPGKDDIPEDTTIQAKTLFLRTEFMIWDNTSGKLVSHGYIEGSRKRSPELTKDDWISLTAEVAGLIVKGTPFATIKS